MSINKRRGGGKGEEGRGTDLDDALPCARGVRGLAVGALLVAHHVFDDDRLQLTIARKM